MLKLTLSSNRHCNVHVYGESVFDLMTLAWPLILQWRRESRKHPDATTLHGDMGTVGFGIDIKNIKRDQLGDTLMQMVRYR